MNYFIKGIKNYVNFSGRARRAEFWYYTLFVLLAMIAAMVVDTIIFGQANVFYYLGAIFFLLPNLATYVRRLHDTNRSGKNLLWYMIAYVAWIVLLFVTGLQAVLICIASGNMDGIPSTFMAVLGIGGLVFFVWSIVMLVWLCTDGTKGENKYGPDPKADLVE